MHIKSQYCLKKKSQFIYIALVQLEEDTESATSSAPVSL